MSTVQPKTSVTPLGLAVAVLIAGLLISLAIPRLRAVSEERNRPEAPRVLSAFPAVASDTGSAGDVVVSRRVSAAAATSVSSVR
ncbi:MAG: hypothetical protein LBB74_08870 [Chitinispirillales bacterium]|jgi:hypothetical protein|nr:hypothetical protein [Chitinispirillales bacterium]